MNVIVQGIVRYVGERVVGKENPVKIKYVQLEQTTPSGRVQMQEVDMAQDSALPELGKRVNIAALVRGREYKGRVYLSASFGRVI